MDPDILAKLPDEIAISYDFLLEHGDATRDIGVSLQKCKSRGRSKSWHGSSTDEPTVSSIAQPGGFRRHHVLQGQEASPGGGPSADEGAPRGAPRVPPSGPVRRYAERTSLVHQLLLLHRAYVDALQLSVEGGGEDDAETPFGLARDPRLAAALLPSPERGLAARRQRGITEPRHLVFMVCKSFVSTAILFLPRCFANGGVLLAGFSLVTVCAVSILCMRMIVDCAERLSRSGGGTCVPSYGDLGEAALGWPGRVLVDLAVVSTQLCFCATTCIFTAVNLAEVVGLASGCELLVPVDGVLALLGAVLVPLALVRRMRHFAVTNLIANFLVFSGLLAILGFSLWRLLSAHAVESPRWVNTQTYPLSLGTAAYTFEGIGMVMPMYAATDPSLQPRFKSILTWTLLGVLLFEVLFATCVYSCFTAETQTIVLLNLPSGNPGKGLVLLLFSVAQLLTFPLFMFPVTTLVESCIFRRSGRTHTDTKLMKNVFRTSVVLGTMLLAAACASKLDNFVALVGALCCAPLSIIYPCVIHSQLVGGQRLLNAALLVAGVSLMVFCTHMALASWGTAAESLQQGCAPNTTSP